MSNLQFKSFFIQFFQNINFLLNKPCQFPPQVVEQSLFLLLYVSDCANASDKEYSFNAYDKANQYQTIFSFFLYVLIALCANASDKEYSFNACWFLDALQSLLSLKRRG